MTDIEGNTNANLPPRRPPNVVENPYGSAGGPSGILPARHPLNILKRILYMVIAVYGMVHYQVYHTILQSPKIRHEWFRIGLATSVGTSVIHSM
jgi:hypothetical protein